MAKAGNWTKTDAELRKLGEQTGLDTLVVLAINDVDQMWGGLHFSSLFDRLSLPKIHRSHLQWQLRLVMYLSKVFFTLIKIL